MTLGVWWSLFLIVIIAGILEELLTKFWIIRTGIPMFVTRYPIFKKEAFENVGTKLAEEGLEGRWYPSLVFKQVSDTELAFRIKFFDFKLGFHFGLPMRGIVTLDSSYQVVMKGFWPFYFPILWIVSTVLFINIFGSQVEELWYGIPLLPTMIYMFAFFVLVQVIIYRQVNQRIKACFE